MAVSCVEFVPVFDDAILHGVEQDMCNDERTRAERASVGYETCVNEVQFDIHLPKESLTVAWQALMAAAHHMPAD